MQWEKLEDYIDVYVTYKLFNGFQYNTFVYVAETDKTRKFWISASSGKKRKEFFKFEDKENKSLGGIKALLWIKEAMLSFPSYFFRDDGKKEYICIEWADSKRRDIYERLKSEGFMFMIENKKKILIKKL